MEILIPGLILVALMVYASTRIKKSAALAYEAETVETDDFIIHKPAGFLNVINGDPHYAFEAYSKEFGPEGAEEIRRATATLTIRRGIAQDRVAANLIGSGITKIGDTNEIVDGIRYRNFELKRKDKGHTFRVYYKLAEKDEKVYELEINALNEPTDEFVRNIETMRDSFILR